LSYRNDNFERIVLPHLDAVYRAAFALSGRQDRAEDLTQTAFLKAFEQFGSFKKGTHCKAWLLRILRNTWIDQLRHQKVVGNTTPIDESLIAAQPQETDVTITDEKDLLENFSDEQVIAALKTLPEEQRFALFLVDVEQLSHEEAARVLQVPVGTVKSRTSRARANLKIKLFSHAKALGFGGER
jgi:RNA polymerase sigma-70 factor (ECF subfamily)